MDSWAGKEEMEDVEIDVYDIDDMGVDLLLEDTYDDHAH
jgi:hypothetical protein